MLPFHTALLTINEYGMHNNIIMWIYVDMQLCNGRSESHAAGGEGASEASLY